MSQHDALDLLKPFLPGLEAALADPDVSEIMINGPGNVWLEGHGRLTKLDAPELDAAALDRAAIHIARPLGLDPATTPILDARLDDGSRVAICVPPASPHVAITVRRFGTRAYSATQLVEQGALPEHIRLAAEQTLHARRNICSAPGFLDSGLKVITFTRPRPVHLNRVAPGLDSASRASPASTARCTSVATRARRSGVPRSWRRSAPTRDSPVTCG